MSTNKFVIDSWAWVEYLNGTKSGSKVKERFDGGVEAYTHLVTLAELASRYNRAGKDPADPKRVVLTLSKIHVPSTDDAYDAGLTHSAIRKRSPNFSLADAFVLQAARKLRATVITGDPDFRGIKEAEILG